MELAPVLRQRFFDADGNPLAGGKLYSYLAGTTTPADTYTDQGGLTANTNPVILDDEGYADVWLAPFAYKFELFDSLDNLIFTVDQVNTLAQSTFQISSYVITDGQAATWLEGEIFDSESISSVEYLAEIRRGTELVVNMRFVVQWKNILAPEWQVYLGEAIGDGKQHGLTFSMTTIGTEGELFVAADVGYGDGTLKLKKVAYATN